MAERMAQKQLSMVKELQANIAENAAAGVAEKVLEGAHALSASTNRVEMAEWVRQAMERLDAEVPESKREKIMAACGLNCARINHRAIEAFRKRRARYRSLDDFIDAESKSPMKGTKLWREGDFVVQAYCPREFSNPMRCYCALVNGLPASEIMSPTYCQCSRAFVKRMWREAIGRPVSVVLLKSALSGATECHFRISFNS